MQVLLSSLRDSQRLLFLDNCEHVLEVSARLVADVVTGQIDVRVIAATLLDDLESFDNPVVGLDDDLEEALVGSVE